MMDFGIRSRFQGAQRFYLFDLLCEKLQESCTRRAVDHLMIARQRQADGVDDGYATVLPHRLELDRVHAENRYLRRVEDWGEGFNTQAPQVADGESGAPQVVGGDGAPHRLFRQLPDPGGKLRQTEFPALPYNRNEQPPLRVAGEAEVDLGVPADLAIDELRVECRRLHQRPHRAEQDHVADGDVRQFRG